MFEKLITSVLNKVLGDFIENIDPAQLNISVLNGNVCLQNMKLKSTLFDSMPLPFSMDYGQIGTINLKIPVWNLLSQPLVIEIRDVFAVVRPKHIKEWNEQVEIKSYRNSNQSMLEQYELFASSTESLIKKDPSSIDKMITKIIDNLEISIKNIYIRYEDSFSAPNHGQGKFVLGLMLKEFSTYTSTSDWTTKLMAQGEDITHKLMKLSNFTIFMDYEFQDQMAIQQQKGVVYLDSAEEKRLVEYNIDYDQLRQDKTNQVFMDILKNEFERKDIKHAYIVDRFSMEARLQLNKNPKGNKQPQLNLNVLLGGQFENFSADDLELEEVAIRLQVHQPQIIRLLKLLEYIGYYNEFQKGALTSFEGKFLSQEISDEYINQYVEWRTYKDEKKHAKLAEEKRKLMQIIEDEYPSGKVIILRKFANKVLTQKEEVKQQKDEIEQKVKELSSKTIGWGLFTSKEKKAKQQKEIDEFRESLQREFQQKLQQDENELELELQQLTKDLGSQSMVSSEDFDKMEMGYIRFKVIIKVPSVKLQLFNEFEQSIFEAAVIQQLILIDLGKGLTKVLYQVLSFRVDDSWTEARSFPTIIETKELDKKGQVIEVKEQQVEQAQSLIFKLESNEPGSVSPFKISIKSDRTLFIVANFHFIKEVKRTILSALQGETLDFSFFQEAATEKALEYMYAGKEFIETIKKGEFKHQALNLSVSLTAPIILIPEDIFNCNKPCLVVDAGLITLESKLVPFDSSINYKEIQTPRNLYDKYEIFLSNFQINILEQGLKEGLTSFQRGQGSQIIEKFDARVSLFNCLDPMHPVFPTAELSIVITSFEIQFGIEFVKSILNIQAGILEQFDTKEEQIFGQASSQKLKDFSDISEMEVLDKIRSKAKEKNKSLPPQGDNDEFYGQLLEGLEPEEYKQMLALERKQSYRGAQQEQQINISQNNQNLSTNFKIYFAVEKLQLSLKDQSQNILILHFGVEVEIDRKMNTNLNLSIYKLLIEDTQTDVNISGPFRMILSSPINELVRQSMASEGRDKYHDALNFQGSVMSRSLLSQLSKVDDEDDEFKDACSSEEDIINNEWDLKLKIEKNKIIIDCQISDLRFIFAVPTAQKVVQILFKLKDIFEDLELKEHDSKKQKLLMYEDALENLDKIAQASDENLVRKIFRNYSKAVGVDQQISKVLYKESIQRLYNLYDIESKIQQAENNQLKQEKTQDNSSTLLKHLKNKFEQLYEKTEDVRSQVSVKAVLRNLSIWVPLNAELDNSQVLSMSFMADLIFIQESVSRNAYEITLNELIKKQPLSSQEQLSFSIKHFLVEMIKSENYFDLFNLTRLSSGFYPKDKYQSSVLINPCRLTIQVNNANDELLLTQKTGVNLNLEPLELQIGFTHIDFGNLIMIQVDKTLKFVKTLSLESDLRNKDFKERQKLRRDSFKPYANRRLEQEKENKRKLRPYRKGEMVKTQHINIKIELETLLISLNDDSSSVDQPLIQIKIQDSNIGIKIIDKEDDAGTLILKKMGIYSLNNLNNKSNNDQYMVIDAFTMINARYFNSRSLFYEPLLEKYYLIAQMKQLTQVGAQHLQVQSEKMLNINLTFGMALTIRKIMDRVLESFKGANVMKKLELDESITQDEVYVAKEWEKRMFKIFKLKVPKFDPQKYLYLQMSTQNLRGEQSIQYNQRAGFIFQNHVGTNLIAELHDSVKADLIRQNSGDQNALNQILSSEMFTKTRQIKLSSDLNSNTFKMFVNHEELTRQWKDIILRKHKGQVIEQIEDDPLKMDFQIDGLLRLEGIPIETLGVHSYRVGFEDTRYSFYKSKDNNIFSKKEAPIERKIGVIVNVKMDGQVKKVSIETQLLIANNLNRPITIFVQEQGQKSYPQDQERTTIQPEQVFRVPVQWLLPHKQYQLVVEGKATTQILFKNMVDLFTDVPNESKLSQIQSQIVRLEHGFFTSVDIHSFVCLPHLGKSTNTGPLQYLVSFNPPVMITNYNFQSLEVRELLQNNQTEVVAAMAPKESAFVNSIDGYGNQKPNLLWIYHEDIDKHISLTTKEFNIPDRLSVQTKYEKFVNNPQFRRDLRQVKLVLEVRKNHFLDNKAYLENFELRERGEFNFTSTVQIMIYPKQMIINKNSMLIRSDGQQIEAYTNEYFSQSKQKVQFNIPGFRNSQPIDISTVGLSGAISLDFDKREDVQINALPQLNYIPHKVELGVIIQTAPSPFNKTTFISVVPRFLIVNQLGHPLVLKQKGCKSQVLMTNQQMPYNFEKNLLRQIMIRQPANMELRQFSQQKRLYQDQADDELQFWSQPFSIEDLEDFQISYPGQDISENHMDVWYMPKPENYYQRFVRVIVTTQNEATILVVLSNPVYPEYEIINKTGMEIQFAQMQESNILNGLAQIKKHISPEDMIVGRFQRMKDRVTVPYVWADRSYQNRLLALKIGSTLKEINIDQGMEKLKIQASNQMNYHVEINVSGNAKRTKISSVNYEKESFKQALYLQNLLKRQTFSQLVINLDLKGIGLSFIDEKPAELLFLSLYGIGIELHRWGESRSDGSGILETMTRVKVHLDHMQLDNMANDIMPVILMPTKSLSKKEIKQRKEKTDIEEVKEQQQISQKKTGNVQIEAAKEEDIPFLQVIVTIAESQDKKSSTTQRRLRTFQVQLQEFIFQMETSILNTNIKFIVELVQTFSDQNNYKVIQANAQSFEKAKYYKREDICETLSAQKSLVLDKDSIQANKMFIELIHLGAIKAILTFKVEKKAFELDVFDPQRGFGVLNLFYTLFSNVANISNSPLSFNELIITNMFVSEDILANQVGKNYARQAALQWYKLIGSSDIIGNPVGLVNKLGTGVYEFVSEPAKGLLKGPDEFVGGVTKGVQSLVSNVISGGFDSVSKITGSLYNVVKNVGGDNKTEIKQSEHIVEGVYQGVKGGVTEIIGGVTGIFTKPFEKTRQEGAKGFFKGMGQGLFGALTAPVTATLRAGTSISQGVAGTATSIGNIGKSSNDTQIDTSSVYARFRPPRYITARNVITEFDEELAQVALIVNEMFKEKYSNQSIRYFCYLPETQANGEIANLNPNSSLLIITENKLLYLKPDKNAGKKAKPTLLFKISLRKIINCEVYQSSSSSIRSGEPTYLLQVTCHSVAQGVFKHLFVCQGDYAKLERIYNLLSILPQCEAEDKVKGTKSKASQILSQIF